MEGPIMDFLPIPQETRRVFDADAASRLPVEPRGDWINETNGQTRLSLSGDGRYSKTQGQRQGTYSGRYSCQGTRIRFIDDFDFVLTGEITGNILRIGEYVYRRA
jgi:hypothetical protein